MKKTKKKTFPYQEISFRASGWMMVFYLGIIKYIQENYKIKNLKLSGSSGGAVSSFMLLCKNIDIDNSVIELERTNYNTNIFNLCDMVKKNINDHIDFVSNKLLKNNQLNITCSCIQNGSINTIIFNKFNNKNDILHYLKASVHIPIIGGLLPYTYDNFYLYDSILTSCHPHITNDCLKISWNKKCNCNCQKTLDVINPYVDIPSTWCIFPPNDCLYDIYIHGYYQAILFFENRHDDRNIEIIESLQKKINKNINNSYLSMMTIFSILSLLCIKIIRR
jgi:hypothetical protein